MNDHELGRRRFLKYGGTAGAAGLTSMSGCMMVRGSMAPNMKPLMKMGLPVVRGAPAKGNYPAKPGDHPKAKVAKKERKMDAVITLMIAYENDTNNYHFMPHAMWVEPGTTVMWKHTKMGISEARTHTTTAITPNTLPGYPRLIPNGVDGWDSGYMPGAMKSKFEYVTGNDESADVGVKDDPKPGVIEHGPNLVEFTREGVYFYLCQNHFGFGMAGVIVVGDLYEKAVKGMDAARKRAVGWAPGMTTPKEQIHSQIAAAEEDPRFAKTIAHKLTGPLRKMVKHGQMPMGGNHG